MAGDAPDLSGLLSSLLSNPNALASVASLLGGARRNEGVPEAAPAEEAAPVGVPPLVPPSAGSGGGWEAPRNGRRQERDCLLAALTPYLSPGRRRALEGACKLLEVLELFEKRT